MIQCGRSFIVAGLLLTLPALHGQTSDRAGTGNSYLKRIELHFVKMAEAGLDRFGPHSTPMWMSVLNTRTGHAILDHTPPRVYRLIGAPGGTTLYWDQPMLVAAHELSRLTGRASFAIMADRYVTSFLQRCVNERGMFQWGNHQYYDATKDEVIHFTGGYHELRPITPAWELFWKQAPTETDRYIRMMVQRHIFDPESGGFNRHDDRTKGHAFIESGGILVESLAWLYQKTNDPELLRLALKIAQYTHSHRGASTGLIVNEPDKGRWDSKVSTTEVGVWAQSLLRASKLTANEAFTEMAETGVSAYLKYGFDADAKKYFGQISVTDGTPVTPDDPGYWPRKYSNPWNLDQWPTHDYSMPFAEACITLFAQTGIDRFKQSIYRWAQVVADDAQSNSGKGAYAEHYGRCIHFLTRAGRVLGDQALTRQARELAHEAVTKLEDNDMFQSFPETHLYRSVDGLGYLFLALISLEQGAELELYGFGF